MNTTSQFVKLGATQCRFLALVSCAIWAAAAISAAEGDAPFQGKKSVYRGFDRFDFAVDKRPVWVVVPKVAAAVKPWVWRALFWDHEPQVDVALLNKGFHVVYMDASDMYGSPATVENWNAFYKELTEKYGFAKKVALEGLSRGGLVCYNWGAVNPEKVACIYGDAPVCDFKSWPGGKGKSKGDAGAWQTILKAYKFENEQQALAYGKNPVDNLKPLADAKVPLLHVCGDADDVVPIEENTLILKERYEKLGGKMELIVKKGVGHHPHSLVDPAPIVDFILKHALPGDNK
jgi:pimeloyl-ACP methyl ester carboxylesterase